MKNVFIFLIWISVLLPSCIHSQHQEPQLVGGPCEGCEAVLEFEKRKISPVDTLPGFKTGAALKISGTIYKTDGITPAEGVVLYIHHTNDDGIYPTRGNEEGWAERHGYIRGWIKTDETGRYIFYSTVPGPYPSRNTPAHIHPYILEPNGKYYYLESFFFKDDPLLKKAHIPEKWRGGSSGIVELKRQNSIYEIRRDFILGRNIPGYNN